MDRIEHGAEAPAADHAAHGRHDDVADRERIELDRRFAAGRGFGGRRLDETAHARRVENVGDAEARMRALFCLKKTSSTWRTLRVAFGPLEAHGAEPASARSFLRIFLRVAGIGARAQQRLEVRDQRAAETEIGRALMRQQREGIGAAAPGERLVAEPAPDRRGRPDAPARRAGRGLDGARRRRGATRHVEIGVLAAEELGHLQPAMRRRPNGHRNSGAPAALKPTTMKGVTPAGRPTWRCQSLRKS